MSVDGGDFDIVSQSLGSGFHTVILSQSANWHDHDNSSLLDVYPTLWFRQKSGSLGNFGNTSSFYRDMHMAVASQSFKVDNAGGFVTGEIVVAKDAEQGPDGRAGFTREYMMVHSASLGLTEIPAELSMSWDEGHATSSLTISSSTKLEGPNYYFTGSGQFPLPADNISDPNHKIYYYHSSSEGGGVNANNLRIKILQVAPDLNPHLSGSAGTTEFLVLRTRDRGENGNGYYAHWGNSNPPHAQTARFSGGENAVSATLTVERNIDRLVEGNERGNAITLLRDGQAIASQGSDGTGYILLNAQPTDTYTPYIDIVERTGSGLGNQMNTGSDVNTVFGDVRTVARIGDLSGITDDIDGTPISGYGIYTDNGFFKGGIVSTYGTIGGFFITSSLISSSNEALVLRSNGEITASAGLIGGFTIDGHSLTTAGVEINNSTQGMFISSSKFLVSHLGDLTASNADITGNITANSGEIGGWILSSSYFADDGNKLKFEPDGQYMISSSKFLVSQSGDVTVRGDVSARDFSKQVLTIDDTTSTTFLKHETIRGIDVTDIYLDGSAASDSKASSVVINLHMECDQSGASLGTEVTDKDGTYRACGAIRNVYIQTVGLEENSLHQFTFQCGVIGSLPVIVKACTISSYGLPAVHGSFANNWLETIVAVNPDWDSSYDMLAHSNQDQSVYHDVANTSFPWLFFAANYGQADSETLFYQFDFQKLGTYNFSHVNTTDAKLLAYSNNIDLLSIYLTNVIGGSSEQVTAAAVNATGLAILTFTGGTSQPFGTYATGDSALLGNLRVGVSGGHELRCSGDIIAYSNSDITLKENINKITNPIEKLKKLSGNTFTWKSHASQTKAGKDDIGLIAQEVNAIFPEITRTVDNIMSVRYEKLIPLLIECIKKQQVQIDQLTKKVED
jgi:roadblock/LC7 domain-containing protein